MGKICRQSVQPVLTHLVDKFLGYLLKIDQGRSIIREYNCSYISWQKRVFVFRFRRSVWTDLLAVGWWHPTRWKRLWKHEKLIEAFTRHWSDHFEIAPIYRSWSYFCIFESEILSLSSRLLKIAQKKNPCRAVRKPPCLSQASLNAVEKR